MNFLSNDNLNSLCLGAAMLGSGGGGKMSCVFPLISSLLDQYGPVRIVQPSDLLPDTLVVPLALVGAPLENQESLITTAMFSSLLSAIKADFPNRPIVLMPAEIGGSNALIPFIAAAELDLPVLDADLIGRAFPKVDMCKPAVLGNLPRVAYLSNAVGEVKYFSPSSFADLEDSARKISIEYDSCAGISVYLFDVGDYEGYAIHGSLTRATQLGALYNDFSFDLGEFCERANALSLIAGTITDVRQVIQDGFLAGSATITGSNSEMCVNFQNEYLSVMRGNNLVGQAPDIFVIFDVESQMPLSSAALCVGLRVAVLSLPAPVFWESGVARGVLGLG